MVSTSMTDDLTRLFSDYRRSSLQSRAAIIASNLAATSQHLSDNSSLLSSLLVYPTPDLPAGGNPEDLTTLLRAKPALHAEEWIEKGHRLGGTQDVPVDHTVNALEEKPNTTLTPEDLKKLWRWAPIEANRLARQRDWGGDYTLEEEAMGIENVITGLRDEDEDDEDEDEDEDERGNQRTKMDKQKGPQGPGPMPLDEVFKFMSTGQPPRSRSNPVSGAR
ncbi:mediator of RNA polymerase II transcription subunit 8 [Ascosphaera pollenicola]|nr:mediator of RNA polymerase II transcription subunit 8 [Ascosphaera pollenicola]